MGAVCGEEVKGGGGGDCDGVGMQFSIEQMQRWLEAEHDRESFVHLVQIGVGAGQEDRRVLSSEIAQSLGLDPLAITKLGHILAVSTDVARDAEFAADFSDWSFLPSYNVHFFRRAYAIDDFLVVEGTLVPRAAVDGTTTTSPGTAFKIEEGSSLPDGSVTCLMTDIVESTPMWIHSRASMYQAMRRHDHLLTSAIAANGGIVL